MGAPTKKRLKQSSKITNAPSYPLLIQEKVSRFLLYWTLKSGRVMNPGDMYEMPLEALREILNCRDDGEIKKALQSLAEIKINWEAFGKQREDCPYVWGYSSLLSDCVITKENTIKYGYSTLMVKELFHPRSYRIFDIEVLMSFKSAYAFKIYQLCGQYYNESSEVCRTPSYSLSDLRVLFNVDESKYDNRYDFIRRVILQPLNEVNDVSNYVAEFKDDGGKPSRRMYWFEVKSLQQKPKTKSLSKKVLGDTEKEQLIQRYNSARESFLKLPDEIRGKIRRRATDENPFLELLSIPERSKEIAKLDSLADEDFPPHYYVELVEEYMTPTLPFLN